MVFGVGISDLPSSIKSYSTWHSMIRRCYSKVYKKGKPSYLNTKVDSSWLILSNFNTWFELNYIEGWQLDKDLLSNFQNLYSESNCCFLPNEINSALHFNMHKNGLYPGVSIKSESGKYIAQYSRNDTNGKRRSIHLLSSNDAYECFLAYKEAKENYLKELSEKYKDRLSVESYKLLNNLQIKEYY